MMIRIFILVVTTLVLASCENCKQGSCYFEVPTKLGPQFLTEQRVSQEIMYARGISDPFVVTQNQTQMESNHFEVATSGIDGFEAIQQRPEWCWAATISMVLNYQGISMSQCEVIRSLGRDCNANELQFGSVSSIVTALRGWQISHFGRPAAVYATSLATGNGTHLIQDVATNWPPIIGLNARKDRPGHVYVLTGIEYSWVPGTWNVPVIWAVQLYDPWDGSYVTMRGSEFDEAFDFAIRVKVQHV